MIDFRTVSIHGDEAHAVSYAHADAVVSSLAGAPNQVIVSAPVGAVTVSLPQDIHTGATPRFAALGLGGAAGAAGIKLYGATSGSLTVLVPAAAGSNTITLPAGTTDFSATGGASQVVKQTSVGGALTVGQLAFTDISGSLAGGQTPAYTGDVTKSAGGTVTVAVNLPTGVTVAGSLLATNIAAPGTPAAGKDSWYADSTDKRFHDKNDAGTIGTTVVADAGASNNFLTAISVAGVITKAQPSSSNLSDASNLALLNAANVFSSATGQSVKKLLLLGSTSGTLTVHAPAAAGTNTLVLPAGSIDFSVTGGASRVVLQTSVGGAFTVAQLAASDLSNGVTGSGAVVLANTPTLITPVLGVATGTSIALTALSSINANAAALPSPTLTSLAALWQLGAAEGAGPCILMDGTTRAVFFGRRSGGTFAAPAASPAGGFLAALEGGGYDTTNLYSTGAFARVGIRAISAWSSTDNSTDIVFQTTPIGSRTIVASMILAAGLIVGASGTDPGIGKISVTNGYLVGTTAGATAGPFSAITNIQTVGGIVTALSGTSDARLKQVDETSRAPWGAADLRGVELQRFRRVRTQAGPCVGEWEWGFVAQDVERTFADAVGVERWQDGSEWKTVDERMLLGTTIRGLVQVDDRLSDHAAWADREIARLTERLDELENAGRRDA